MVHLNEVLPDVVLLEEVVHPDEVPPLEEDEVPLEEMPPDVVLLEEVVHPDEVPLPRGG